MPQAGASNTWTNPQAFNQSRGDLKLGPMPVQEELRIEAERVLREQAMLERDPSAQYDNLFPQPTVPGLASPSTAELPPHPPSFKTVDVKREVEKVRDARKRIRLEPSALVNVDPNSPQAATLRARGLPSICAYTMHDVGEGYVVPRAPSIISLPKLTFRQCTVLYIFPGYVLDGCWVLGELRPPLEPERRETPRNAQRFSDERYQRWSECFVLAMINVAHDRADCCPAASLRRIKEKGGSATRKLIGHSGPVYSVAFDPHSGSAAPPRYLLSASADATARLWSLDTMTNVVAYRGHQNPVWDVQWSPLGIYFATASRDRTARLWSTDRSATLRVYAGHLSDVDVR